MNKNLKKVIAVAMSVSAVSAFAPSSAFAVEASNGKTAVGTENKAGTETEKTAVSTDTTKKDDSTSKKDDSTTKKENETSKFSSINLETSGGSTIKFYSDDDYDSDDRVEDKDAEPDEKYYAKTSSSRIKFDISGVEDKYVKIFKGTSKSNKGKDADEKISLSKGSNTITVKIYDEKVEDKTVKYDDDDYNELASYKFVVKYKTSSSDNDDDDDDDQDDIYLKDIILSDGEIDFDDDKSTYNIKVNKDVDKIDITAKADGDDDDYEVYIDGERADYDDDHERWRQEDVKLHSGKNEIKVKIEDADDDDEHRTYTLNITRGEAEENTTGSYLDTLKLGSSELTISDDVKAYNFKVPNKTDEITIKAEPKDSDYTVTIDGDEVDDDDSYSKKVEIKDDVVNSYKVVVKNTSGTEQTYTLNIAHENVDNSKFPVINTSTTNSNNTTNNNNSSNNNNNTVTNGWNQDNSGNWSYYENGVKATGWRQLGGQWYFMDSLGTMLTGWQSIGGSMYYLNPNSDGTRGAMLTGWQFNYSNNAWYYLNPVSDGTRGAAMTGWYQDTTGTWYYSYADGKMAANTVINGYRLNGSGAWVR